VTGSAATTHAVVTSIDGTAIAYQTVGAGEGLLVLGGAWRSGRDYLCLAESLSGLYSVHVIDRRGRGESGPQGASYGMDREVEDLLAAQGQTGARIVFGHSYGGLIALEAARHTAVFSDVVVYEPGVSISGSIPLGWMDRYRERLAADDPRGAFAAMVRGAGGVPRALERMPLWYVKLLLRVFIKQRKWRQIQPVLEAGLAEHEEVRALDQPSVERYGTITANVLLLGGGERRPSTTNDVFDRLTAAIPNCSSELIDGLDHTAPDEGAPSIVAERVLRHLRQ
jgi:pimeloyl-ACP methyl ester carboxylesterase